MGNGQYLMEHGEEARRLDLKTDRASLERQALWAGIGPGMRVADVGCGSGKTTSYLYRLVQPDGEAVGIDASVERVAHAEQHYRTRGLQYLCRDFYHPMADLGRFDFIWVRFVLEYHRSHSQDIVRNLIQLLNPGGILCLVDLDHNCLNHYGLSRRLEQTIIGVMRHLEEHHDFDPYAGRKLYSYLYDQGLQDISASLSAHHLIYGPLNEVDDYNWTSKLEVAARNSGYPFAEYEGGFEQFREEFRTFFADPRRFTYTPLIACRGIREQVETEVEIK